MEALRDGDANANTMQNAANLEKVPSLSRLRAHAFAKEAGRPPKRLWSESGANQPTSGCCCNSEFYACILLLAGFLPGTGHGMLIEGARALVGDSWGCRPQNTERRNECAFASHAAEAELSTLPLCCIRVWRELVTFEDTSMAQQACHCWNANASESLSALHRSALCDHTPLPRIALHCIEGSQGV